MSVEYIIAMISENLPIISMVLTVVFGIYGRWWAVHKFNRQNEINRDLQKEKADLDEKVNTVIKEQEFENQRRLTEFSLYANKRHEKYIELFEAMAEAVNIINIITSSFRNRKSFEDFGRKDIEELLDQIKITHWEKENLLQTWENDHKEGVKELRDLDIRIERVEAINITNTARVACVKAKLYMPTELYEEIRKFTYDMWSLAFDVKCYDELREQHAIALDADNINELKQRPERAKLLNERFEFLTEKLQKELCK